MTEFVEADAFIVVTIDGQVQHILFAETGWLTAGAANAFVLIGRVGMVSIFGHVGIDLVFADDDEIHAIGNHGLEGVRPAREEVRDEIVSALQGEVGDFGGGGDRHAFDVDAFFVELASDVAIAFANKFEEGFGRSGYGRALSG